MDEHPPGVGPSAVASARELRACLRSLRMRRGLSYGDLDKAAKKLPGGRQRLPSSTLTDLLAESGKLPSKEVFSTFLAACGVSEQDLAQWLAAWERAGTADVDRPGTAIRMRDARPRLLGVHAAIQVADAPSDLPVYVPRDVDADLREAVDGAARQGGFVLLIGGSSAGKTRTLFEAVRAVLPQWWLSHPASAADVQALASAPKERIVVWLDELQLYINGRGEDHLAGAVRELIGGGAVIVGTLWPHEYTSRIVQPGLGRRDPSAEDRALLRMAQVIDVAETLSAGERHRAKELAHTDQRIRIALDSTDAGFTQVLAAGPELIRWWEQAPEPYGRALITAALDARRVGAQSPLSLGLLTAGRAGVPHASRAGHRAAGVGGRRVCIRDPGRAWCDRRADPGGRRYG